MGTELKPVTKISKSKSKSSSKLTVVEPCVNDVCLNIVDPDVVDPDVVDPVIVDPVVVDPVVVDPVVVPVERKLVDVEITDENIALNVLVNYVNLAQRRGVFSFEESAKIWECVKKFSRN